MSEAVPSLSPHKGKSWGPWLSLMSEAVPSLSSHKGKSWGAWLSLIKEDSFLSEEEEDHEIFRLLPRKDLELYGAIPKVETRALVVCNQCERVLRPQALQAHCSHSHSKEASGDFLAPPPPESSIFKKKSSHSKSKRKTVLPLPVPPPPLFPKNSTPQHTTTSDLPPPILQPVEQTQSHSLQTSASTSSSASHSSSSTSSSRYKKSRKSSKSQKAFNPEKHCGVVEGNKGPCLRSLNCSTHQVSLKRVISVRGKDLSESITDHKVTKDSRKLAAVPVPIVPRLESKSLPLIATNVDVITVPNVVTSESNSRLPPAYSKTATSLSSTSIQTLHISSTTTNSNNRDFIPVQSSQESIFQETPVCSASSIVYMPMSPVSVVSPIQFIQLGAPILRLASPRPAPSPPLPNQPFIVTIPECTNITVYNSHPKPLTMPTIAKKIGGSFMLQNQRLERQRNEIQVAINTKRQTTLNYKSVSLLNTHHHRPNILKSAARSNIKVNSVKRATVDKLTTSECKQIRLTPDVNGFILHADMSEAAEAPQSNNSIHEKIALLNMK